MEMNIERYHELIETEKKFKMLDEEYGNLYDDLQETAQDVKEKEEQIKKLYEALDNKDKEHNEDIARFEGIITGWRQAIEVFLKMVAS